MGLESYLFYIELHQELSEQALDGLLTSIKLKLTMTEGESLSGYRDYYYELSTEKGITEVHSLFSPNKTTIKEFSLRFSVASPTEVIDQSFNLLAKLNQKMPVRVRDTEIKNHIYRQLRREGKTGDHFDGLTEEEDNGINQLCYIPIDVNEFKRNKLGLMKRKVILEDKGGKAVIHGGSETFDHIEKTNSFEKLMGWIKKEL